MDERNGDGGPAEKVGEGDEGEKLAEGGGVVASISVSLSARKRRMAGGSVGLDEVKKAAMALTGKPVRRTMRVRVSSGMSERREKRGVGVDGADAMRAAMGCMADWLRGQGGW